MLGTREEMVNNAPNAISTNTNQALGLLIALGVILTLRLRLAVQYKPIVDATPGTWVQMEPHACNAAPVLISQDWGLRVRAVPLIQSLHLAVSKTPHVSATQGTLGQMEPHARSAVSINTKQDWVQLLALTVH